MRSFAQRRQWSTTSVSQTCGRGLSGIRIPFAWVRITPDTAPSSIQRISSSRLRRFSISAKKPPMSEPHVLTPDSPIVSPLVTTERRPSKPQSTVGSPPQTIGDATSACPSSRSAQSAPRRGAASKAAQWYWRG